MTLEFQNPDAILQIAEQHLAARRYQQCHQLCIEAIKHDPNHPKPYYLLGVLTADHQNFAKAVELFERAIAGNSNEARYHAQRAKCLTAINRSQDASEAADKAAQCGPKDALTLDTIGVVLARIGRHKDAVPFFQKAVSKTPNHANYHYNLGSALQFSGDFKSAERAYLTCLALAPDLYKAYSSLVSLQKQSSDNNLITAMQEQFNQCNDPDGKLYLGHAIAKSCEDISECKQSLEWLIAAKSDKRKTLNYDRAFDKKLFAAAKALPELQIAEAPTTTTPAPVFVVGMPRTGTTLVDRILSSHSQVKSVGELTEFAMILKKTAATPSRFVMDPETFAKVPEIDLSAIGKTYLQSTSRLHKNSPLFVDKMPLNFFYVPLILAAIPNARIICLRRGAMDACLSNFRQLFRTSYSYYNYAYSLEDTAHYYAHFARLMAHWQTILPANRFMQINYEDIIFEQETQTRRLINFCNLPWEEACLDFHQNQAPVATASAVQVRQPLYSSSIGRWKRYGEAIERLKQALLAEGIEPE